jgi:hypothetical protein
MVCAGFPYLNLPDEEEVGDAAMEGTAAGEYLQRLLEGKTKEIPQVASNGVYFDNDMKFYLTPIYEDIMSRTSEPVRCEQRIDWQTQSGIWIKGQPDIDFVDSYGRLCIEDLKYGWGIVEVKENWQLLGYAIGSIIRRGQAFKEISLKIHQPRPHHEDGTTREWLISYSKLLEYKEKIERRMIEIVNGKRDLQTGKHCKYCMGAAEACPAFNRLFYRALEVCTEFSQDSITNEELSRQLDQISRYEEVIKIKKDSLTELGSIRIKKGEIIPGYIQTQKFGHRTWKASVSPEAIKIITGIDVMESTMMSPTKAEKIGVPKELVKSLASRSLAGVKLEKKNATDVGNKIFGTEQPNGRN